MAAKSNTKLTKAQKQWLKEFKFAYPDVEFFTDECRVTIAVSAPFKGSNNIKVSNSIKSTDEYKFRPKVGEYYAAQRMLKCEWITLNKYNFDAYELMYHM